MNNLYYSNQQLKKVNEELKAANELPEAQKIASKLQKHRKKVAELIRIQRKRKKKVKTDLEKIAE